MRSLMLSRCRRLSRRGLGFGGAHIVVGMCCRLGQWIGGLKLLLVRRGCCLCKCGWMLGFCQLTLRFKGLLRMAGKISIDSFGLMLSLR